MALRLFTATMVILAWAEPAFACVICHSPTSLGVLHELFEHDFATNAAAVAAPIPILLGAIWLIAHEPDHQRE